MSNNIKEEIVGRISAFLKITDNAYSAQYAAIDEIQIILEGFEDHFSPKFIGLISGSWGKTSSARRTTATRLLAILNAEQFKSENFPSSDEAEALLPVFVLDETDKERMLKLASDIRKIVTASTSFDEPHKVRLLNRITAMENEVHKPKGRFDVFLGGLSDFGETAGKFGNDIKPLTDRVREMVGIARKNTKEYDKLAPPEEQLELPHPDEFDEDAG